MVDPNILISAPRPKFEVSVKMSVIDQLSELLIEIF